MLIKMKDILNFTTFYDSIKFTKLPIKTSYRITQLAKTIETELSFYRTKLQEVVDEYGEKDENDMFVLTNDGGIKIRPNMEKECYEVMSELQELEITLPDITFTFEEFDNIELEPQLMEAIFPFIKE